MKTELSEVVKPRLELSEHDDYRLCIYGAPGAYYCALDSFTATLPLPVHH